MSSTQPSAEMQFIISSNMMLSLKRVKIANWMSNYNRIKISNRLALAELEKKSKTSLDYIDCHYFNFMLEKAHTKLTRQLRFFKRTQRELIDYGSSVRRCYLINTKRSVTANKASQAKLLEYRGILLDQIHAIHALNLQNQRMVCATKQALVKVKKMQIVL